MKTAGQWRFGLMAGFVLTAGCTGTAGCAGTTAGPVAATPPAAERTAAEVAAPRPYLAEGTGVQSLAYLPPPPAAGSAAFAHDEEVSRAALALRGTARWRLAVEDVNRNFPRVASTYSCALGTAITLRDTPTLYRLMQRVNADSSRATRSAKDHYRRVRPYVVNGQPTCDPAAEAALRGDGAYPSGHGSRGWLWGLVLSEVAPDRTPALLARGRAYGESRLICNVHWRSDVQAARELATAVYARLHASPEFRADVEAARAEVVAARTRGVPPDRDCAAEAAAMAEWTLPAP
jgi:acid phosphatase (class A)